MKKYSTTERKIVKCISDLPTKSFLLELKTEDQLIHWINSHAYWSLVSQCFKATYQGQENPIRSLVDSKDISQLFHDQVWYATRYYQRLWELIQVSFCFIQPVLKKLKIPLVSDSAFNLFCYSVMFDSNAEFNICLKGFAEIPSYKKYKKEYDMIKNLSMGKVNKIQSIEALSLLEAKTSKTKNEANVLLLIVLDICEKKATSREPILKDALDDFWTALHRVCKHQTTVYRETGSCQWQNGEILEAQVGGKYKKS